MRILLIGDIFGEFGRKAIEDNLPKLIAEYGINFVVANGENIAHGKGITYKYYQWLLEQHVNVVTLGNHTFSNRTIVEHMDEAKNLIRPLNYGPGTPGKGYVTINYNGKKITVFQVLGRTFENNSLDCPFRAAEKVLKEVKSDIYICDFHGEATSEKIAFGLYFDGKIDIIVGTHTHVQTNDARVMRNGTMYMTDLGMTGPLEGVIGVTPDDIFHRLLTGMPARHTPMVTGKKQFCGLLVEINENTRKVTKYDIINIVQ